MLQKFCQGTVKIEWTLSINFSNIKFYDDCQWIIYVDIWLDYVHLLELMHFDVNVYLRGFINQDI